MKADLLTGAMYVGEALLAAGALAVVNASHANTDRGTFALAAKPDNTGGVDLDVVVGGTLLLIAAAVPSGASPHLMALGIGSLAVYAERKGTAYGMRHQSAGFYPALAPRVGFGSTSGYRVKAADQWMGPVDDYAQGLAYAHPVHSSQTF